MADIVTTILASLSLGNPIALLVNLIVSTIVGGIVFLVVVVVFAKAFSEEAPVARAFGVVLIINLINIFGILSLITPFLAAIPFAGYAMLILPLLIWIGLVKAFFGEMETSHIAAIGVVGYVLSILIIPLLVGIVQGFLPAMV